MKHLRKIWGKPSKAVAQLIVVAIIAVSVMFGIILTNGSAEESQIGDTGSKGEMAIIPEEFVIYQDYLETIGGKPGISDVGTIEATIISITKSEVCPDKIDPFAAEPTGCSIEPYPKDLAVIRIDKIISYTPYSQQTVKPVIDQPGNGKSQEKIKTTSGFEGSEYPSQPKLYEALQEGQEVQSLFLLTARPAKIIYVPTTESEGGMESAQLAEDDTQQTVGHQAEPGEKVFKPIPKDGNYYVFTTKIGEFAETVEKSLPGLEVGTRFRAEIHYDGSLYIEEYEEVS